MTAPRPAVVDQADLEWEGGEEANLATGTGIRWKLLIAGERTETEDLATGIAEVAPGAELMRHHHEPAEIYYIMSGRGEMEIEGRTHALLLLVGLVCENQRKQARLYRVAIRAHISYVHFRYQVGPGCAVYIPPTPSMRCAAPARTRWSSCSPSRATASTRSSITSIGRGEALPALTPFRLWG